MYKFQKDINLTQEIFGMRCHMQPMDAMMPLKTKSIQFMILFTYVALHALAKSKMVAFKLKERWGFNPGT